MSGGLMLLNSFTRPLLFLGVHVPNQESWRIGVFVYRFYLCCYDFTISPHNHANGQLY
jgi:hypothetical protein